MSRRIPDQRTELLSMSHNRRIAPASQSMPTTKLPVSEIQSSYWHNTNRGRFETHSFTAAAFTSSRKSLSCRADTGLGESAIRQVPLAVFGKAIRWQAGQSKPSSLRALVQGTNGFAPLRSIAWFNSRRSSKSSTRCRKAPISSWRSAIVGRRRALRRAGLSVTLLIRFFPVLDGIHLNAPSDQPEKHSELPNAQRIFVRGSGQFLHVSLKA
jgi:hypothetical protein